MIKTDPANLDYTIISGARRQENRWDPTQNEQIVPETKETQRRLFDDAMYKLEHGLKDQKTSEDVKPALCRLFQRNDDVWKDNFEANLKLRAQFRKSKKEAKAAEDADNNILSRTSLVGLSLLPETDEDRQLASLLKLHSTKSIQDKSREKFKEIMEKPALPSATIVSSFCGMKKEKLLSQKPAILGIVKKKEVDQEPVEKKQKVDDKTAVTSLVAAYSSSSEDENE